MQDADETRIVSKTGTSMESNAHGTSEDEHAPTPSGSSVPPGRDGKHNFGAKNRMVDSIRKEFTWSRFLAVIGWIAVFCLVLYPQGTMHKTQTELNKQTLSKMNSPEQQEQGKLGVEGTKTNIQLAREQIKHLELEIEKLQDQKARFEGELTHLNNQTKAVAELNAIRESLKPRVQYGKFVDRITAPGKIVLAHEIKNIGQNTVIVSAPTVRLSPKPSGDRSDTRDFLVLGRDYKVITPSLGMVQPGIALQGMYEIVFLGAKIPQSPLYCVFTWRATTDPAAVSIARRMLGKKLSTSEWSEVSTALNTTDVKISSYR